MKQETTSNDQERLGGAPLLVCMLPARNAEQDLPAYLDCVSIFCDAVVALDDGSTDGTYGILEAHPLVKVLLRNPVRDDYRGWDDSANRNQLLVAAESLQPEWLISLDADERVDERDATSIREFLQTDALPGFAYGFRHVPMRNDGEHFVPTYQWVYRLFSAERNQRFPPQKLHFIPVPTTIPRDRWIKTTLRIQHLGGLTPQHRLTRFNKYLEADPLRTYQEDYSNLLVTPDAEGIRRWQPRPQSVPILLEGGFDDEPLPDVEQPALSAIIISRNDEATIANTVASVVEQEVPEPFEVILVTSGTDRTAEIVRERFPTVTVVELPSPALPGDARNAGLNVSRGSFVTFPGSHIELLPGSLAARLKAHRRGYAMVTGVVLNGTPTPAGWASYFLDHSEGLPGHAAAEFDGPPGNCSYARLPLLEVGGFPEGVRTGEDTSANRALVRRGYVAFRDPAVQFIHLSRCTTIPRLLRHHFQRGRGSGRMLLAEYRERGHLLNRRVIRTRLVDAVPNRLQRIRKGVSLANDDIVTHYGKYRGLVLLGALATYAGTWYEVFRPTRGKLAVLAGKPVVNLLLVSDGRDAPRIAFVQMDEVNGQATMRSLSPGLKVPGDGAPQALDGVLAEMDASATPSQMANLRASMSKMLNVEDLEYLAVPALRLPEASTSVTREIPSLTGLAGQMLRPSTMARIFGVARTRALRSTLSPWSTVVVLKRLGVFATRSPGSDTESG